MRLRLIRKHYRSDDEGKTWIPKVPYASKEAVREAGLPAHKWDIYRCDFCGFLHVAKIKRERDHDN